MRNGLKVLQLPGRYGYAVTLVVWVRRITGDEYEGLNACVLARRGQYKLDGLQKLAAEGPGKSYDVTKPSKQPEEIHRLMVWRCLPANEEAWKEHCPAAGQLGGARRVKAFARAADQVTRFTSVRACERCRARVLHHQVVRFDRATGFKSYHHEPTPHRCVERSTAHDNHRPRR